MPGLRRDDVIVITGASTGIGRAVALEFAKCGMRLVLASRQQDKLDEVAHECEQNGVKCLVQVVDVADAKSVEKLGQSALQKFGRVDVWLNNAGIAAMGAFWDIPLEEHRKVLETNLMGYLNGAFTALKIFRAQGRGILINNASICSHLTPPNLASYNTSKFAIRGLTHSLRQDLAFEKSKNIYICQVNPGVVDTPAFKNAANFSGKKLSIKFPMATPEQVAKKIVSVANNPMSEVFVGFLPWLGAVAFRLMPRLTSWILTWSTHKFYYAAK